MQLTLQPVPACFDIRNREVNTHLTQVTYFLIRAMFLFINYHNGVFFNVIPIKTTFATTGFFAIISDVTVFCVFSFVLNMNMKQSLLNFRLITRSCPLLESKLWPINYLYVYSLIANRHFY